MMTKRDHLSAMALQGILASPHRPARFEQAAQMAVSCADALIEELRKSPATSGNPHARHPFGETGDQAWEEEP